MAAGLGFKDFTTGEVLTAADVDGYLMQGIWVFANSTARDAAVTSPQEGNFAFLKDTNTTTYYTGSAWTNLDTTGMVNPMTTTGDMIYSSSGSTPARLGLGTANQVLTVNSGGTAPEWKTPAAGGGGKVLQVVNATYSTATSNSTSTMADTGLSLSITPSSATSKVLVIVDQAGLSRGNQDDTNAVRLRLLRGATEILGDFAGNVGSNTSGYLWAGASGASYLDSPATTSSTTYKTQFKNNRNGALVTVQSDSSVSTITLLEIGA